MATTTDFLVLGSGVAGLTAAPEIAIALPRRVDLEIVSSSRG